MGWPNRPGGSWGGPVGPVGWPAGPLAQLARGAFCFLDFSFLLFFYLISFLFYFVPHFILVL